MNITQDAAGFGRPPCLPAAAIACLATAVTLLLLPCLELSTRQARIPPDAARLNTVSLPPPVAPVRPRIRPAERRDRAVVDLELAHEKTKQTPVKPEFPLAIDLATIKGSFSIGPGSGEGIVVGAFDAAVFELADLDSPPQPLARLKPMYPAFARMRGVEGYVTIEFIVDATGGTRDMDVLAAEPTGVFEKSAERAIKSWRFNPGMRAGEPVAVRVRQRVTFSLED